MKTAIIGATGFVGGYLVDALLEAGHEVSVLLRPGSEGKLRRRDEVRVVPGDLAAPEALCELMQGTEALIYNVGLLREFPRRGITFEAVQYRGVVDAVGAAKEAGVGRLLLMSAIGVKSPGTAYQDTKYRAEQYAHGSGLATTVLRPSVIFGDPRGTMEFATQLYHEMVRPPVPALAFAGVRMSPVHIEDVARAFVAALERDDTIGKTCELAGPEQLSWAEMLRRIGEATGRDKWMLPMPLAPMKLAATLFDWLPFFPVTRDQLIMLEEGNTASPEQLEDLIGAPARRFEAAQLAYLDAP